MLTASQIARELRRLGLPADRPAIAHASLSAFGEVEGGAEAVVDALLDSCAGLVMPTFTYQAMVVPETGPPGNGLLYGSGTYSNRGVLCFDLGMPADRLMGAVPEALRRRTAATRSSHPILSFAGVGAESALQAQALAEPLAPVGALLRQDGWVALLGVDHMVNTSIHYGEKLAGRRQFIRWARTSDKIVGDIIVECPGFPGCSDGFQAIEPTVRGFTSEGKVGKATVRLLPLRLLIETVRLRVEEDPQALLCSRSYCERCAAVREFRL